MAILPPWPGRYTMPAPLRISWRRPACEALTPGRLPLPELLWIGSGPSGPCEIPLVIPAWAREKIPGMAEALDAGCERRRAAGLPDGRD